MLDLIYCAGGNETLSQIAHEEGWLLGMRSDKSLKCQTPTFIDIDYKKPDFEKHLSIVAMHRPKYATVPDLSDKRVDQADVERALEQYELISQYCEIPLIVPKLSGQIALLPPSVAIGYSVPSGYGGAQYPLWELAGRRRIHMLGGSPKKQIQTYLHLKPIAEVVSLDGNYAQKQAVQYAMYWYKHRWVYHHLKDIGVKNLYFECWRWSCQNILAEWKRMTASI